jgi:hypothetical protein
MKPSACEGDSGGWYCDEGFGCLCIVGVDLGGRDGEEGAAHGVLGHL